MSPRSPPGPDLPTPQARLFLARLRLLAAVAGAVSLGLLGRAVWLQGVQHEHLARLAADQHIDTIRIPAHRGDIVDRNQAALAISVEVPSIFANPREVVDVPTCARQLAGILDVREQVLAQRLGQERFFVWLRRQVEPQVAEQVAALKLPGVRITREPRRYYPNRDAASVLLGFAGLDARGLEGVEHAFDQPLVGAPYKVAAVRDARGRALLATGGGDWARRARGQTLTLGLDLPLQHTVEAALADARHGSRARAAYAVVLEVASAEVLALAVVPGFNANQAAQIDHQQRRNRAIADLFEPGSVLKPLVVAAALETGAIDEHSRFSGEGGRLRIGRHAIGDTSVHAEMSLTEVLAKSSNIGMAKVGQALGRTALFTALGQFGLTQRTGIELPGEVAGLLRPPSAWSELDLATIAFGQGVAVNLVQMAAAYRVLAAQGLYQPPRLARSLHRPDGTLVPLPVPAARRVVSAATAARVTAMLEASVLPERGTGRLAQVPGYRVAGKTGTAQKADLRAGGYSRDRYLALFAGYLPADAPKVVIVIAIDEPESSHYGGVVAAPVFARVGAAAMQRLGVGPAHVERAAESSPPSLAQAGPGEIDNADDAFVRVAAAAGVDPHRVPSFLGMTARQAVRHAAGLAAGWQLTIEGSGRVIGQSPAPGSDLAQARELALTLGR